MNPWYVVLLALAVFAGAAGLYGLHRLCLWLEERGQLYYWHKKPGSSPASSLVALQQAIEPTAKHVLHVKDEKRAHAEDEGDGKRLTGDSDGEIMPNEAERP